MIWFIFSLLSIHIIHNSEAHKYSIKRIKSGVLLSHYHFLCRHPAVTWCFFLLVADIRPLQYVFYCHRIGLYVSILHFLTRSTFFFISLSFLATFLFGLFRDQTYCLNKNSSHWLHIIHHNCWCAAKDFRKNCLHFKWHCHLNHLIHFKHWRPAWPICRGLFIYYSRYYCDSTLSSFFIMVSDYVLQMFLSLAACCEYYCYLTEHGLVIFSEPRATQSETNR